MNKKTLKILFVMILTILLITIHNTISNAAGSNISFDWSSIKNQADSFINAGKDGGGGSLINSENLGGLVGRVR